MEGEEVVQVYLKNNSASVEVPIRSLAAFSRVYLKTNETKTVEFIIKAEKFSFIDSTFNRLVEPGKFLISVGGRQPDNKYVFQTSVLQAEINITGDIIKLEK
jgi:beta-glucosidase